MIEVEEREKNAGITEKEYERTHPDLDESLHTYNFKGRQRIAGASKGSPSYGLQGCACQTLDLRAEDTLREFKFERRNQWLGTKRRDPDNWTPKVWNRVYGFPRGIAEGWAGRRDGLFAGKFRGAADPKESFHPVSAQNEAYIWILD